MPLVYGKRIFPPPRSAAKLIAAWIAAVSSVIPSPFAPKSKTLNFYCQNKNIDALIHENEQTKNFIFTYIRKDIIEKCQSKVHYNSLLSIFNKSELKFFFAVSKTSIHS